MANTKKQHSGGLCRSPDLVSEAARPSGDQRFCVVTISNTASVVASCHKDIRL